MRSFTLAGVQGLNVGPPVRNVALTMQEQPFHPSPSWQPGVQGPNVGAPVRRFSRLVQEQPDHPEPFALAAFQVAPPIIFPVRPPLLTRQEQPWHPAPSSWAGVAPRRLLPPTALLFTAEVVAGPNGTGILFSGVKATGATEDLTISYVRADAVAAPKVVVLAAQPDGFFSIVVSPLASAGYVCTATTAITLAKAYAQATVP